MNKAMLEFEKLVVNAKREECPAVNVAHQVLYRINQTQSRYDRPLALFAAWSTAAAALMAVLSAYAMYSASDPISPIFALASAMTP